MKRDDRFFQYVRHFLMVYLPRNRCCSENTVKSYRETLRLLSLYLDEKEAIPFTKITFERLDRHTITRFLDWLELERNCSITTRNQRFAVIKSFFKYAAQEDPALMMNYVELERVPVKRAPPQTISYLSEKALACLLKQPQNTNKGIRDRFFMILMYDSGARVQELLDLRIKDLHLNDSISSVYLTGKGQKMRVVPLLKKTIIHLEQYMKHYHSSDQVKEDDLLFYTVIKAKKGKMSADNVSSFLKLYGDSARLECYEVPQRIHAHLFRHTRAMHLYKMGMPLSYIKDFLGHSSVNTTSIYASADVSMLKEALEKAAARNDIPLEIPTWQKDEGLLLQLCGLK